MRHLSYSDKCNLCFNHSILNITEVYIFKIIILTNLQVKPVFTLSMVLVSLSPCLIKAWKKPQQHMISRFIAYAFTCGFLFGWHVHEKASLHFVIPLSFVAVQTLDDARHFFLLSIGMLLYIHLFSSF